MPVPRTLAPHLRQLARRHPVVVLTGPRQSGKTTLCRSVFADKAYVSLEDPDVRRFALEDPRGLLAQHAAGAIFDEVQHAPELASYLQRIVDEDLAPGRFVLTGSQHFGVTQTVSQSLAGRAAIVHLLPCSLAELEHFPGSREHLLEVLVAGGYPAIHDRQLSAAEWLASYTATYVERDVRQVLNVSDLLSFQTFLGLCAGHGGQMVNLSSLASAAGITHNTARAWLSVLEGSFLVHRLPPLVANLKKRLVKTPKLHFYDSGLQCYLLGIRDPDQLLRHPSRGAVFESWVVSEVIKAHLHRGVAARVSFFRDRHGDEVDLIVEHGQALLAVEAKSGSTIAADFLEALRRFARTVAASPLEGRTLRSVLVYGGAERQERSDGLVLPWREVSAFDWAGEEVG